MKKKSTIWSFRVDNYESLNSEILECISSVPPNRSDVSIDKIYNSDYDSDSKLRKIYGDIFLKYGQGGWIEEVQRHYRVSEMNVEDMWFHQYVKGDVFNMHFHPKSNISFIYYVELPETSAVTEFFYVEEQEIVQPNVQEGDILFFPSYYPHRSPLISSDSRKTILSGNISFYRVLSI